ncbi:MAG: SprT family zinc-dependent metalloprotease [Sulfurimonadaceae bacterium]|jgi:predicted metal-dependent hydrolase|nr:SprT family zinc-dependent metalloprotease [Sulfurimonadaceae bacterium]
MRNFRFKDFEISHITKRNLKNSYIQIGADANIIVKTPKVSEAFVLQLLESKEGWIRKRITQASTIQKPRLQDEVLLFGAIISIDAHEVQSLQKSLQSVSVDENKKIVHHYNKFYNLYAHEHLLMRLNHFSFIMKLPYKEMRIKKLKSRWGSCDSLARITFNQELIKVKKELIDYVVVHELAHLVHMNHSPEFHALVRSYLPDADTLRKELKAISLHKLSFDD